jgi:hypothetical protein
MPAMRIRAFEWTSFLTGLKSVMGLPAHSSVRCSDYSNHLADFTSSDKSRKAGSRHGCPPVCAGR